MLPSGLPIGQGHVTPADYPRNTTIDLARGFASLSLPAIHTVLLCSQSEVHGSWLGILLAFLAEPVAAPLFLFLMGMVLVIGKPPSFGKTVRKAAMLLLLGYLLNWLRLGWPSQAGRMPETLVEPYITYPDYPMLSLLLTGDILHTAALSLIVLYWISRGAVNKVLLGYLYVSVAGVSPFLWGLNGHPLIISHVTGLLFSDDYRAFFPLFPWLCYPVAGLLAGKYYSLEPKGFRKQTVWIGLTMFLIGGLVYSLSPPGWEADFYRGGPGRTIAQTGGILLWLTGWQRLSRYLQNTNIALLLRFCSRQVTLFYCIQWIIVGWSIGLFGYRQLDLFFSLIAVLVNTLLSLLLTVYLSRMVSFVNKYLHNTRQ